MKDIGLENGRLLCGYRAPYILDSIVIRNRHGSVFVVMFELAALGQSLGFRSKEMNSDRKRSKAKRACKTE